MSSHQSGSQPQYMSSPILYHLAIILCCVQSNAMTIACKSFALITYSIALEVILHVL